MSAARPLSRAVLAPAALTSRGMPALERAAAGLIVVFLSVGLHRVFVTNISWDEFYYLSFVHLFRSGELTLPLQTIHVRLFAWLPWVSGDEIQQIFAARASMWLVNLLSAWMIFRVTRRFAGYVGALFTVVLYLSFSYVIDHGTSFRADPLCALAFLLAADLVVNRSERPYAVPLAAFAMALGVLVSMKTVFYLPTVAVLLAAPLVTQPRRIVGARRIAVFAGCFLVALIGGFVWHQYGLAPPVNAAAFVTTAGRKTLGVGSDAVAWPYVVRSATDNPLTWILIATGLWLAVRRLGQADRRVDAIMILAFALPLLSLPIYRNTFPYFYVFLMPAAVIPAALAVDGLVARARQPGGAMASVTLCASLGLAAVGYAASYARTLPDQTLAQAETVRAIHSMFPEPVPYIDRNSMIASFPKVGFFMSTWGLDSYRAANRPIMADLLARYAPPLLLANTPALDLDTLRQGVESDSRYNLLPADVDVLRENYVHHWGAIYVAGKSLMPPADGRALSFEILIPGVYTLEAESETELDGVARAPGATVNLGRGSHWMATPEGQTQPVMLRWGRDLFVPEQPPSTQPIYFGY